MENIEQYAVLLGLLVYGSLVGFVGKKNVAGLYTVALLLVPFGNDTTFNRYADLGH